MYGSGVPDASHRLHSRRLLSPVSPTGSKGDGSVQFSDQQLEFAAAIRAYCSANCGSRPQRLALTDNGRLANSPEILHAMGEMGWLGVSLPSDYGGAGAGMVDECLFLEETSRGAAPIPSYSTALTAAQTYLHHGRPDQKRAVVEVICRGGLEAISLSEPDAGSDLAAVRTKADRRGDAFVLNGHKTWTSVAHVAEHLLVLARTDGTGTKHQGLTLFMVPAETAGMEVRAIETMDAWTVNDVFLTDVVLPEDAVVGDVGMAWGHLMRGLSVERLIIAATALGAAERAFDDLLAYVKQRKQFDRVIGTFQAIRHRIADLATELAVCRSFVYDVAVAIDAGQEEELSREASMAKLKCTETAKHATLEAMQLMGGYGYAREYGVEEQVRKALAPPIYGGTNEIQRDIIGKSFGL